MPYFTRRRKIGSVLIALSFVPYGLACWHTSRHNWTPLNHKVLLRKGEIRSPEFVPEVDGRYILFIDVRPRRIEMQRLDCLLDTEFFKPERCQGIPNVVELDWTLWNGARAVADRSSQQTWRALSVSNESTRREIGRFDARRGERYVLAIDFRRDPSELNVAEPKLVAEVMQDWEGFAIEVQGTFALGLLLAAAGVVFLMPFRRPRLSERLPTRP